MRQFARSLVRPAAAGRLRLLAAALLALGVAAPAASAQSKPSKKTAKTAKTAKPAPKPAAKPAAKPAPKKSAAPAKPPAPAKPVARKPAAAKAAPVPKPAILAEAPGPATYTVIRATSLQLAPSEGATGAGTTRGEIRPGTTVEVVAREHGWVRVRTDGWVREGDLTPADSSIRTSVSAADLRTSPEKLRGVLVKWTVEFLALQTADTLRRGLAAGEQYLLVRGPGQETALMYLTIPPKLLGTARALPALSKMIVVARVRDGRSEPAGVPILDVQSIQPIK